MSVCAFLCARVPVGVVPSSPSCDSKTTATPPIPLSLSFGSLWIFWGVFPIRCTMRESAAPRKVLMLDGRSRWGKSNASFPHALHIHGYEPHTPSLAAHHTTAQCVSHQLAQPHPAVLASRCVFLFGKGRVAVICALCLQGRLILIRSIYLSHTTDRARYPRQAHFLGPTGRHL